MTKEGRKKRCWWPADTTSIGKPLEELEVLKSQHGTSVELLWRRCPFPGRDTQPYITVLASLRVIDQNRNEIASWSI